MARALIVTPDPDNPGGVILNELRNVEKAWMEEPSGVLGIQQNVDSGTVYYAPGAWHSWTRDDHVRLMQDV